MQGMLILLSHLLGDYILQSSWMADGKIKWWWPAFCHAAVYTVAVSLILKLSWIAIAIVLVSHLFIDRFRLAKYVTFASNFLSPPSAWPKWEDCKAIGYHHDLPPWLSVWLMIVSDNAMYLAILMWAVRL